MCTLMVRVYSSEDDAPAMESWAATAEAELEYDYEWESLGHDDLVTMGDDGLELMAKGLCFDAGEPYGCCIAWAVYDDNGDFSHASTWEPDDDED